MQDSIKIQAFPQAKLDPVPQSIRKSGTGGYKQGNGMVNSHPETSLGIIDDIVNAAGSMVSLLIHVFKKPPADTWAIWSWADRKKYVTQSLQMATAAVITGKAISVTNTFRKFIAKVEVNYNWEKWQKKNPQYSLMIYQAENEVKRYQISGYNKYMQYINPQIIYRIQHPATASTNKPATASLLGGNSTIMLVLAIGATALLVKVVTSKPEVLYVPEYEGNRKGGKS